MEFPVQGLIIPFMPGRQRIIDNAPPPGPFYDMHDKGGLLLPTYSTRTLLLDIRPAAGYTLPKSGTVQPQRKTIKFASQDNLRNPIL